MYLSTRMFITLFYTSIHNIAPKEGSQGGLTSGRRPVVKIIAESLSQHDEKHVVPTPLSGIRVGKRKDIISHPFPFGVDRDHFLPLATILTNTFRFFHCHQIPHTWSPVSGTPDLALL
jgi:hypothetical protein